MTETTTADRLRQQQPVRPASADASTTILAKAPVHSLANLQQLLSSRRPVFTEILPRGFDAGRFLRLVMVEAGKTPALLTCSAESVLGGAIVCAELGLMPGPLGHVYLIPRRVKGVMVAQVQIGYKGYSDLATRDQRVIELRADVVYERDEFDWEEGSDAHLRHRRDHRIPPEERGPIVAAWCLARLRSTGEPFIVLGKGDVEARRRRSSSPDSPAWTNDYAAMARKSAVRALAGSGLLPLSVDLSYALAADERVNTMVAPGALDLLAATTEEEGAGEEEPKKGTEQPIVVDVTPTVTPDAPAEGRPRARGRRPQPPVPPGGGDATAPAVPADATTPAGEHDTAPAGAQPEEDPVVICPTCSGARPRSTIVNGRCSVCGPKPDGQEELPGVAAAPAPAERTPRTYAQQYSDAVLQDVANLSQHSRQTWLTLREGLCAEWETDPTTIGSAKPWIESLDEDRLGLLHRKVREKLREARLPITNGWPG